MKKSKSHKRRRKQYVKTSRQKKRPLTRKSSRKSKYYTRKNKKGGWWLFRNESLDPADAINWGGPLPQNHREPDFRRRPRPMRYREMKRAHRTRKAANEFNYEKIRVPSEVENIQNEINEKIDEVLKGRELDAQQEQVYKNFRKAALNVKEKARGGPMNWRLTVADLVKFAKATIPVLAMQKLDDRQKLGDGLDIREGEYDDARNKFVNDWLEKVGADPLHPEIDIVTSKQAGEILKLLNNFIEEDDEEDDEEDKEEDEEKEDDDIIPDAAPPASPRRHRNLRRENQENLVWAYTDPGIAGQHLADGRYTRRAYYHPAIGGWRGRHSIRKKY